MICDPLTKRMEGNFLRAVASHKLGPLRKLGFEQQKAEYGLMLLHIRYQWLKRHKVWPWPV